MNDQKTVIILGGSGFLGSRVAEKISTSGLVLPDGRRMETPRIIIADQTAPQPGTTDYPSVSYENIEMTDRNALEHLIGEDAALVFHLAAVVSGTAEEDFDLGMAVNLQGTINVLDACRRTERFLPFITTSSLAVFGADAPPVIDARTPRNPQSSYGTQKAITELLCADYRRKAFVDARVLRLPTITVRPGKPNGAASSFVSGIIREPISGVESVCPVDPFLPLWIASPATTITNIVASAAVAPALWPNQPLDMPGISVSSRAMITDLAAHTSSSVADRVTYQINDRINSIVSTWPQKIDNAEALRLGFTADLSFAAILKDYLQSVA